ncbi:MAG: formyltransferase family protein [Campylobacterota bacterium]|nr:formyltransferase family protein [Campylobacterota bacterium]
MLPTELNGETITLPKTDRHTIVIVTGKELRHKRFAYRLLQEFDDRVLAWYELDNSVTPHNNGLEKNQKTKQDDQHSSSKIEKIIDILTRELPENIKKYGFSHTLDRIKSLGSDLYYRLFFIRKTDKKMAEAEEKLFALEVEKLQKTTRLIPIKIDPDDLHTAEFVDEIKKHDPYFFLTLSGPLYKKPLLESIRGAAINQHAGHSPLLKGSNTIHWALYHRELNHVSSTVHITNTGADAGQILRRSNPCIFPTDTIETVFLRSVALGTELMISSVKEIISNKEVIVFDQPKSAGMTYLNKRYNLQIAKAVARDFNAGWLRVALNEKRSF